MASPIRNSSWPTLPKSDLCSKMTVTPKCWFQGLPPELNERRSAEADRWLLLLLQRVNKFARDARPALVPRTAHHAGREDAPETRSGGPGPEDHRGVASEGGASPAPGARDFSTPCPAEVLELSKSTHTHTHTDVRGACEEPARSLRADPNQGLCDGHGAPRRPSLRRRRAARARFGPPNAWQGLHKERWKRARPASQQHKAA